MRPWSSLRIATSRQRRFLASVGRIPPLRDAHTDPGDTISLPPPLSPAPLKIFGSKTLTFDAMHVLVLFMSRAAAKQERAEQMLGELAELGLMLARDLATQARAAEDTEEKVALTAAFQQTSRAVRLTLALDFKLTRDLARDAAEAAREEKAQAADAALRESRIMQAAEAAHLSLTAPSPAQVQKRRVRNVLNRLLWTESEGDQEEYDVLRDDLDARLCEAEDAPGFADLPIEVLARKLKADMRLSGELVVTTAAGIAPANASDPPLADTG